MAGEVRNDNKDNMNGIHTVTLENVCLLSNNNLIIFNNDDNNDNSDNSGGSRVFPASLKRTLKRRGFMPWLGRSHDSLLELNVGATYSGSGSGSGGVDIDIDIDNDTGKDKLLAKGTHIRWIDEQSVLVRPYYRDNLFHFVQSLSVLMNKLKLPGVVAVIVVLAVTTVVMIVVVVVVVVIITPQYPAVSICWIMICIYWSGVTHSWKW